LLDSQTKTNLCSLLAGFPQALRLLLHTHTHTHLFSKWPHTHTHTDTHTHKLQISAYTYNLSFWLPHTHRLQIYLFGHARACISLFWWTYKSQHIGGSHSCKFHTHFTLLQQIPFLSNYNTHFFNNTNLAWRLWLQHTTHFLLGGGSFSWKSQDTPQQISCLVMALTPPNCKPFLPT
jgi:hypothetical protein